MRQFEIDGTVHFKVFIYAESQGEAIEKLKEYWGFICDASHDAISEIKILDISEESFMGCRFEIWDMLIIFILGFIIFLCGIHVMAPFHMFLGLAFMAYSFVNHEIQY